MGPRLAGRPRRCRRMEAGSRALAIRLSGYRCRARHWISTRPPSRRIDRTRSPSSAHSCRKPSSVNSTVDHRRKYPRKAGLGRTGLVAAIFSSVSAAKRRRRLQAFEGTSRYSRKRRARSVRPMLPTPRCHEQPPAISSPQASRSWRRRDVTTRDRKTPDRKSEDRHRDCGCRAFRYHNRAPSLRRSAARMAKPHVIYGIVDDGVVLMAHDFFLRLLAIWRAAARSATWAGFLVQLPHPLREEVISRLDGDTPQSDAAFSIEDIPGFSDGDWPPFANQEMMTLLPEGVKVMGKIGETNFNGPRLDIPASQEFAVVDELRKLGWSVERHDSLVLEAMNLIDGFSRACDTRER